MTPTTYSLSNDNGDFYSVLSHFTDRVVEKASCLLSPVADFEDFVVANALETKRVTATYQLELLTMALLWHNNGDAATRTSKEAALLCERLVAARSCHPECRRQIDAVRGILNTKYLLGNDGDVSSSSTTDVSRFVLNLERFDILLRWMRANGEFREECRRFALRRRFLHAAPLYVSRSLLRGAALFAHWFKEKAARLYAAGGSLLSSGNCGARSSVCDL